MIDEIKKRLLSYQPVSVDYDPDREQAAVLLPIVLNESPALVLTERSSKLDSHGGEVAWPGGKKDATDESLMFTALRESDEEIGLRPHQVEIVGELRPFISKFGLIVTPYVGLVAQNVDFRCNEDEISSIFHVPLEFLLNDPRTSTDIIEASVKAYLFALNKIKAHTLPQFPSEPSPV